MYKLYYSPGACSMGPHVILNELGVSFEPIKINLDSGEHKKPEFLKINPRGQVPVLVEDNGTPIKEGAAIILHLLDKHGSPLLPKSGMDRTKAIEWLMWCNASLHPAYGKAFWASNVITDKPVLDSTLKAIVANIQTYWDEAETRLSQNKYLAGNFLSPGDILMTVIADWGQWLPSQPKLGPNVMRVIKEVSGRPSFQKALKTEHMEYKAAA